MPQTRPHPQSKRPLEADMLSFDVQEQLKHLKSEDVWRWGERNAITLWKGRAMRVVLVALHAGAVLADHHADGPVTVHVVEGHVDFVSDAGTKSLCEGQVAALHAGVNHRLIARSEAAFLLTLAVADAKADGR